MGCIGNDNNFLRALVALMMCLPVTVLADTTGDGAEQTAIGVLPVAGVDRATASSLGEQLTKALEAKTQQHSFVGPKALGQQISKHPETQQAMARVEEQLAQAEEATLRMDRPAALGAAEAALQAALEGFADLHTSRALVRAHVARALALLLEPADRKAARAAFGAVLTLDASYQPGVGGLAPRAERLLRQARKKHQRSQPQPALESDVLASVMSRAGLEHIVQVSVEVTISGGAIATVQRLFDNELSRIRREFSVAPQALGVAQIAPLVAQFLELQPLVARPDTRRKKARRDKRRRDGGAWYRKWWVWTAAGVVLAGAGVSLAVALSGDDAGGQQSDARQPVTLRVEFK